MSEGESVSDFILSNPIPSAISGQAGANVLFLTGGTAAPAEPPPDAPTGMIMWLEPDINKFWADTDKTVGIDVPVGFPQPFAVWEDSTINANDAVQATGEKQPLFTLAEDAGEPLPMVLFDGIDNLLRCDTLAAIMSGTDKAATIAVVYKDTSEAGDGGQCLFGFGNSGNDTPFCYESGNWNAGTTILAKVGDDGSNATPSLDIAPDNNIHVLVIRINGTTIDVWQDNVREVTAGGLNTNAATLNTFALGNLVRTTEASLWYLGYIGEWMAWDSAITDEVVDITNAYLMYYWGI